MDVEEFIKRVIEALNREFEELDNGILLEIKNDEFQKQGFELDKNRSQYIQYCYGNFANAEVIDIEE